MKLTKKHVWFLVISSMLVLCLLGQGQAVAQSSTNYRIERSVVDTGGGERRSLNYTVCDSLGQPSGTIVSTSAQYIHIPGFYECVVQSSGPPPIKTPPVTVVPEPGTMILLGLGLGGLLIVVRRTRRSY
jgi:hypothetical protein